MSEYIECRSCPSPSCKGCNIYTLATMLRRGTFDGLMNGNRSINPAADVVEVKHGRWKEVEWQFGDVYYDCSVCGESFCLIEGTPTDNLYNYCPNCGAKMDGE